MGYNIEISFNMLKHANVSELKQLITDLALESNCNHYYYLYELEGKCKLPRNHCVIVVNFEDDEINTQFPLSLQNLSSNTNVMNQTMVLNNEDDYWPIPPLIDTSGNIVQFHQPFVNASGNNGYSSIPSLPIQITLNERIEIIPKNTCPVAEDPFCPICYENYEKNNIIKTECGHCFCFDCVKRFTKDNKKCPMCRGEILKLNVHMENLLL
jgi:hypothetical protein